MVDTNERKGKSVVSHDDSNVFDALVHLYQLLKPDTNPKEIRRNW